MEKPIIFDARKVRVQTIKGEHQVSQIVDLYSEQLEDLFLIRNPRYKFEKDYKKAFEAFIVNHAEGGILEHCGMWVYFPWNGKLVHYLSDDAHQEIRTARNKNLITEEEQAKFYNVNIGVAGLSVGSHGAITTVLMGGGRVLKLADPDTVSASNLNRMRFDFTQLGVNKAELIAQYIYQLNPYAEIDVYAEGINGNNMDSFLNGLDVLVEELDDIEVKIKMREGARKRKIPVIMATDSSDNVILDIERFDLHPGAPVFHGVLTGMDLSDIKTNRTKLFEAMGRIIDLRLITERQLGSVREVGKTIYSWPQLATAATASGAVLAYAIRRIVLDQPLIEGKCKLNLDALLDSDYSETMRKQRRVLAKFMSEMSVPFGVRGGILALWKKIFSKK